MFKHELCNETGPTPYSPTPPAWADGAKILVKWKIHRIWSNSLSFDADFQVDLGYGNEKAIIYFREEIWT